MKTIAIANHKGGCAKTTTALNMAVTLANTGSRVLAADLDPQGNLATLYTARQNLDKNIRAKIIEKFTEDFVFQTTIPRAISVGEIRNR
jgi:chromosome partitioning protein